MNNAEKGKAKETFTALERLKQVLHYCNGMLFWKEKIAKKVIIGTRAGWAHPSLIYREVRVDTIQYKEHRVIWALHNGKWPEHEIDHINNIRDDNRIENLRDVPHRQNQLNLPLRKDNKYGCKGIRWRSDKNRWQAYATVLGKFKSIGHFETKEAAMEARKLYLGEVL